jgi:hypothetical protein
MNAALARGSRLFLPPLRLPHLVIQLCVRSRPLENIDQIKTLAAYGECLLQGSPSTRDPHGPERPAPTGRPAKLHRPAARVLYFPNASTPALPTCASCSEVAPDTPTAPTTLPSTMMGIPPSSGLAPASLSSRRLGPPCPTRSWNTLVGRR